MRKSKTHLLMSVAMIVTLLVSNTFALQDGTRIKFQRGRTSATVNGTVAQGGPDFYLVGVRKRQTLTIHVDGDVTFGLDSPRGQATEEDGNTAYRAETDFDGDYTIRVYSARGVQKYYLTVSVR